MRFLLLLLFLSPSLAADTLAHKKGFVFGLGGLVGRHQFPQRFAGETEDKIDDTSTFIGPMASLGYDVIPFSRLLLGLRLEGMSGDRLGMGGEEKDSITNRTSGRLYGAGANLRLGWVFDFRGRNMVDQDFYLIGEFFLEGGQFSGRKDMALGYRNNKDGNDETYDVDLRETFQSRSFAVGVNLASDRGGFVELKLQRIAPTTNRQELSGTQKTNSGALQPVNQTFRDENMKGVSLIAIQLGQHF